jgi:hypothetical protein
MVRLMIGQDPNAAFTFVRQQIWTSPKIVRDVCGCVIGRDSTGVPHRSQREISQASCKSLGNNAVLAQLSLAQ